jgi:uncharacterized protein
MNIVVAGESLTLCPDRAIYWPRRRTVVIADTHFGKDEIFRRAGHAVPQGISAHDLQRISTLLILYDADRLVVLGDFFHGSPDRSEEFRTLFEAWLAAHQRLRIDIVAGNHDRHGATGLWNDRLNWQQEPYIDPPFALTHRPLLAEGHYTVSGHIHPVLRLSSRGGDRARLPVFWFGATQAVLPAFGTFTGGADIRPDRGDQVFAIAGAAIVPIPFGTLTGTAVP